MNILKDRMTEGRATRALWLEAGSPVMAEAAVHAGARFVLIDNEHGPATIETTAHMLRAVEAAGGHAMVRVAANDPARLKRVLEIGLSSILVPMVNTAAEARAAVAACRYPPLGQRGFAGDIRAARYGTDAGYGARAHEDLLLMVQIESPEGVENAAEIAAVEGVDMLFLGPYDLSGGYGHLGQTDHADVQAAADRLLALSRDTGMPLGTVPRAGKSVADLLTGGFRLVIYGSEVGMAMAGIAADLATGDPDWL